MNNEIKAFDTFGVMLDCSRNGVANIPFIENFIGYLAKMGYNSLMLYTEETYEIPGEPYFGYKRGRFTQEELRGLDAYAAERGVKLIPCIQTLAHLGQMFRWDRYSKVNDCADILLCGEEKTYELIDEMFASVAASYSSRLVHVGMDEAHMIGRGRYQDLHGHENHTEILLRHLERVAKIAEKYGFTLLMWSDMFFRLYEGYGYLEDEGFPGVPEEIRARIPKNVELVYWDYYFTEEEHYEKQFSFHDQVKKTGWFAAGGWTWLGFVPHNRYAMKTSGPAVRVCRERGVRNFLMTLWGDDGGECGRLSTLPALWYAAELARGNEDLTEIAAGFERTFGLPWEQFLLTDLPGTPSDEMKGASDPDKGMLYDDPFLNFLGDGVREGGAEQYRLAAEKLEAYEGPEEFRYVFRTCAAAARALSVKYGLGMRTREAYLAGDKKALAALCDDYLAAADALEKLYLALEGQWTLENKPQGFEVQDARFGAILRRLAHCRARILAYLAGGAESIPELEEPVLPYRQDGPPYLENRWHNVITAGIL